MSGKAYQGERAIVSLVSGRAGIHNVGPCIFSILAFSPGFHIRLSVSRKDFPGGESDLPDDLLLMLRKDVFELWLTENDVKSDVKTPFGRDSTYGCPVISIDSGTVFTFDFAGELYRMYTEMHGRKSVEIPGEPGDVLPQIVVSLTTWKGRINHPDFPANLRSLLEQDTRARYRVCLVLSREEFGERYILPAGVREIARKYRHFEVIWTDRDTKALKNYDPTARKYPDLPVIVLGDDTIYDRKLVERVWRTWLGSDRRTCFGAAVARSHEALGILSPYRIRLFPPRCMAELDEEYFLKYFHGHNDLFNGLRLRMAGTRVVKADWDGLWHRAFAQDVRLMEYHSIPEWKVIEEFINKIVK